MVAEMLASLAGPAGSGDLAGENAAKAKELSLSRSIAHIDRKFMRWPFLCCGRPRNGGPRAGLGEWMTARRVGSGPLCRTSV